MNITWIIIVVILVIFAIVFVYYGGFIKVTCRIEKQKGDKLVYKQMTVDYAKSAKLMDEMYYSLLNDYAIETYKGFGIHYDNPKKVEKSKVRSEIGCIIEDKDSSKLTQIAEGLSTKTFPERLYIVTAFPSKGKVSILFGIMKVYPSIEKFVEGNGYKNEGSVMEIYDAPNKKSVYGKEMID